MSKFTEDAKLLLEYIGGKDNIKAGNTLCNTYALCID